MSGLLRTERLILQPVGLDAAKALRAAAPGQWTWLDGAPYEGTQVAAAMLLLAADAGRWQAEWGIFVIVRVEDDVAVGGIGFHGPPKDGRVEIGFDLTPSARGHGYATEALRALAGWALGQDGVGTVIGRTEEENVGSQHALERAGFVRVDSSDGMRRYELRA